MSIDIYQPCPCHSGKKIKFCCGKDIVNDLNEILDLTSGKQLLAAKDHIDRVIEKTGSRDCLLTLKTHILIKMEQFDEATRSNELFMENNPHNSIGHQHRATLFAANGEIDSAIHSLQDALDDLPGDEVPVSLSNGFKLVGLSLLRMGHPFAARAHLEYAGQLMGDGPDEELGQFLYESYRMPWPILLLKTELDLEEANDDAPWQKNFNVAIRLRMQGQWRKALQVFQAIGRQQTEKGADVAPEILKAIASMYSLMGDRENMVQSWRKYSQHPETERHDAIDAELLVQYFDDNPSSSDLNIDKVTIDVSDSQKLLERMADHAHYLNMGQIEFDAEQGPPPQAAFIMLDKPQLTKFENIDFADIPQVVGQVLVFGRQTDRDPRCELITVHDETFATKYQQLCDLLGDLSLESEQNETLEQIDAADHYMNWEWHIPQEVGSDERRALVRQRTEKSILDRWPEIEFALLGGKTPNQCAGSSEYDVRLEALVYRLAQVYSNHGNGDEAIGKLREKLQLPVFEMIDPTKMDPAKISVTRLEHVDFEAVDDDQIQAMFSQSMLIGNYPVLRKLVPQLLTREHLQDEVSFPQALTVLARITIDNEQAMAHLARARKLAADGGDTIGKYLVMELDMRLERGMTDQCEKLMKAIQTRHWNEPNLEMLLVQTLSRHGLIRPDGRPVEPSEMGPTAVEPEEPGTEGGLWTPETAGQSSSGEESKLWLPGSD